MAHPPAWIEELVHQLACSLFPQEMPNPLGCHIHEEHGSWEVAIFPSMRKKPSRGPRPDVLAPAFFSFDIQQAMSVFEDVIHLDWITSPMTEENEAGSHLLIEGVVHGQPILVRICAEIPKRFQSDPELIISA